MITKMSEAFLQVKRYRVVDFRRRPKLRGRGSRRDPLRSVRQKLLREPRAFNLHTSRHIMRLMGRSDDKWRKYLFY